MIKTEHNFAYCFTYSFISEKVLNVGWWISHKEFVSG